MLPIRDALPVRTFPYVVLGLIALQAIVFVGIVLPGGARWQMADWLDRSSPSSVAAPVAALAVNPGAIVWLANALYLWLFGEAVEDRLGHVRFLAFFVICGVGAALVASALTADNRVVVGATGATSAVLGAHIALFRGARILALVPIPFRWHVVEVWASYLVILWFLLPVVGQFGLAAAMAPLAGVTETLAMSVAGLAIGAALARPLRRRERDHASWWGP